MLIAICEAVTVRVDHFLLQAFRACTYTVMERSMRAELTIQFKLWKEILEEGYIDR